MLDDIRSFLKRLNESETYRGWKKTHKNSYLCSAFAIGQDINKVSWQLDFFEPENVKITSFTEMNGAIRMQEEDIFKKPEGIVNDLDIDKVKIDLDRAIKKIEEYKKKKYPGESPTQKIFILQSLAVIVWNITYINSSFNILNIKINAMNGKIVEDSLTPIMGFKDKKFDRSAFDKFIK